MATPDRSARTGECFAGSRPFARPDPTLPLPPAAGRVAVSWSGGKDSAMALARLRQDPRFEVVELLTTVSRQYRRVSHHGVRIELLEQQAAAIGLPLRIVWFGNATGDPAATTMAEFEAELGHELARLREHDVHLVAHGDINLQSLRDYREQRLATVGMRATFPLWDEDTTALLHSFTAAGFRAVICCAEPVAASLAGAELGSDLLDEWPPGVDPCGENGEFHSFVYDGPIFDRPVRFRRGAQVERDGRHYTDLLPVS